VFGDGLRPTDDGKSPCFGVRGFGWHSRFYRIFAFAIGRRCGPGSSSPNPPTFPYVQYHPTEAGGRIAQAQEKGSRRTSSLFHHSTRWSRNELTRPDNLPCTRLPTVESVTIEHLIHSTTVWRYEAGRGRRVRLASEPAGRRGISVYRGRQHGTASRQREQLHIDFPEGSHTADGRLLVRGGYPYCGYYPYPPCSGTIPIRLANDEKRLAGALFIAPALRHVEDAIPAPASKRSRSG
jgi:hypothetical protein